jgi:hypothetical protein
MRNISSPFAISTHKDIMERPMSVYTLHRPSRFSSRKGRNCPSCSSSLDFNVSVPQGETHTNGNIDFDEHMNGSKDRIPREFKKNIDMDFVA